MSKIVTLALALSCLPVFADSLRCAAGKQVTYEGISCCTERISAEKCKGLVEGLDRSVRERVASVQKDMVDNKYKYGQAPNCFWNAMAYHSKDIASKAEPIDHPELAELVKKNFTRTATPRAGDVLVFEAAVTEHVYKDEYEPRYPFSYEIPLHAAVYLGEGILFQKENITSDAFSIDTVEHARAVYNRGSGGLGRLVSCKVSLNYYRAN